MANFFYLLYVCFFVCCVVDYVLYVSTMNSISIEIKKINPKNRIKIKSEVMSFVNRFSHDTLYQFILNVFVTTAKHPCNKANRTCTIGI